MTKHLDAQITETLAQVSSALTQRNWNLGTAESCTGGWIAKCCTDLPGSSAWFDGGFVTYSYPAKEAQLDVIGEDLEVHGAVSEEIAAQMALGARRRMGVAMALAATGIAGPDGGLPNKPVGLVCFAWSMRGGVMRTESKVFAGDRNSVRHQTVLHALQGVLLTLEA